RKAKPKTEVASYLVSENFESIDSEILTMQDVIVKQLPFIRVKGVPGLKYLYPQIINVTTLLQEERLLTEQDLVEKPALKPFLQEKENVWVLIAKKKMMQESGMT